MTIFEAVVLAIVEGITEFLPVSSTGHMIIASSVMGIAEDDFTKSFTIAIQFGAILSVVVLYWKRFFRSLDFYFKIFVAFIPALIAGFLLNDYIDSLLDNVLVVAIALVAGGIILIMVDKWFKLDKLHPQPVLEQPELPDADKRYGFTKKKSGDEISYAKAFKIGMFQCISLIPGVSRSAATIIGGLTQKLTRRAAAEFSFFLAVPTMFAATVYKMYEFFDDGNAFSSDEYFPLIIGNVIAFLVAILAMRSFVNFLTRHGFKLFGWYRIFVGAIILILLALGIDLEVV